MYARDLQMIQFKLQIHLPVDFNWLDRSNKKKLQSVSSCFWSLFLFANIIVFTHRMHISIVIRFFSIHHQTDRYKNDEFPPIILYFPQKLSVCALFFLFCCLVQAVRSNIKNKMKSTPECTIFKLKYASCCSVLPTMPKHSILNGINAICLIERERTKKLCAHIPSKFKLMVSRSISNAQSKNKNQQKCIKTQCILGFWIKLP